ncbi:MAG: choice-of-anchor M domain-containing protein [Fimbriimonadaceae bacterium]|nr:choice-of-anchor M domain-containing protein [Fimbriimonadaceae bacterium]QYK59357.1 MAG: choice-of-anchor M domain-containing protein [Fimbriimonadaceae bacterium]
MNIKTPLLAYVALASAVAHAQYNHVITEGPYDIGIGYEDGWHLHVHDEVGMNELEPEEVLFYLSADSRLTIPNDPRFSFLGGNPGDDVWVIPQIENPLVPFLGVGSEEMPGDFFDSYFESDPRINGQGRWIALQLVDLRGPGQFSVWTTGDLGDPTVWMATSDGILGDDKIFDLEGGHAHYNWAFTASGIYEMDVRAMAFKDGHLLTSDVVTFNFGVEAVPEPAVLVATGVALGALLRRRWKS